MIKYIPWIILQQQLDVLNLAKTFDCKVLERKRTLDPGQKTQVLLGLPYLTEKVTSAFRSWLLLHVKWEKNEIKAEDPFSPETLGLWIWNLALSFIPTWSPTSPRPQPPGTRAAKGKVNHRRSDWGKNGLFSLFSGAFLQTDCMAQRSVLAFTQETWNSQVCPRYCAKS